MAADSGATPLEGPTTEAVREATGGRGVDAVIDAVALDATLNDALACVRPGGTVSVIGVHSLEPYPLPILTSLFRSVTLRMMLRADAEADTPEHTVVLASADEFTDAYQTAIERTTAIAPWYGGSDRALRPARGHGHHAGSEGRRCVHDRVDLLRLDFLLQRQSERYRGNSRQCDRWLSRGSPTGCFGS